MATGRKKKTKAAASNQLETSDQLYVFCTRFFRDINFFKENPDLQYREPYVGLIKDLGIDKASKIMDAIYMVYDPKSSASNSGRLTEEEVKQQVQDHFLKDKNFMWTKYSEIIAAYNSDCKTKIEKQLDFWYKQLQGKTAYLDGLPWSVSAEEKDSLLKSHEALFNSYYKILDVAKKERKEVRLRGNIHRSLVEVVPETK